jgi:hypothetical protein
LLPAHDFFGHRLRKWGSVFKKYKMPGSLADSEIKKWSSSPRWKRQRWFWGQNSGKESTGITSGSSFVNDLFFGVQRMSKLKRQLSDTKIILFFVSPETDVAWVWWWCGALSARTSLPKCTHFCTQNSYSYDGPCIGAVFFAFLRIAKRADDVRGSRVVGASARCVC